MKKEVKLCSKCRQNPRRKGQRWCIECHAGYIRVNRHKWPLSEEQKQKAACRAKTYAYRVRGYFSPGPCAICASTENIEAHHHDYSKPFVITWLCRGHHTMVTMGLMDSPPPQPILWQIANMPTPPKSYDRPHPKFEGVLLPSWD